MATSEPFGAILSSVTVEPDAVAVVAVPSMVALTMLATVDATSNVSVLSPTKYSVTVSALARFVLEISTVGFSAMTSSTGVEYSDVPPDPERVCSARYTV